MCNIPVELKTKKLYLVNGECILYWDQISNEWVVEEVCLLRGGTSKFNYCGQNIDFALQKLTAGCQ